MEGMEEKVVMHLDLVNFMKDMEVVEEDMGEMEAIMVVEGWIWRRWWR